MQSIYHDVLLNEAVSKGLTVPVVTSMEQQRLGATLANVFFFRSHLQDFLPVNTVGRLVMLL